jgi:hypothetical protein
MPESKTLIDASVTKPGKTYHIAHGIEKPDGSLHGISAKFPKLFDDPEYCPRLIRLLAEQNKVPESEIGKPVIVAIVRVDS